MYKEIDYPYEGLAHISLNPIYFSFFPTNFNVMKRTVVKESISTFRSAFTHIKIYFEKYAKENEKFDDIILYNGSEYNTLMVPVSISDRGEVYKFIVNRIREKTKFWGLNKTTTFVLPTYSDLKEIFTEYEYESLKKYISTYYELIIA